ncbi:N-acetylmuramoyl-L-alanine amidase [Agrobacterium vitis]|uniref:N-acetylmuramoyl-L-alanine amidase n=4 Tax=Agrobacterium vitis TaxID=373 RepID=A0A368NUI6_AGRVI|nr:AMIN domain-containing protein [Agrobacterium vitis]KAA3532434.1 AMIN domain-containing protein [Agrobacterium vitis]MCF1475463.1 N-acetylmuramoyl-L-alanine amidase [Agrobacterium vitis]MUZ95305.1 AMIN domain-containing protein [Agrobacterium vitis]MVA29996.1 AMIN domain-containing protein [Agrobacterium vitis]
MVRSTMESMRQGKRPGVAILWLLACIVSGFAPAKAFSADRLAAFAARVAGDDARTRIVMDFDQKPETTVRYIGNPDRIVVDLPATVFAFPADALVARGLFRDIRFGSIDATHSRIVLTTARPAKLVLTDIRQNDEGQGFRLILDAEMTDNDTFSKLVASQAWEADAYNNGKSPRIEQAAPATDGEFLIAVDAGHGGIDTGATGKTTNTPEKTVTLGFARALAAELNRQKGVKAFLTRDGDTFLSLSQRVTLARQKGANLFISLHADMLGQANIRGATVYTISDKASDHLAEAAAARENQSDEVGGVDASAEPQEVSDILADLTRRETQAFSIAMAKSVVTSFDGQINLINNPHRFAGFRVLQAQDVPSVLLELGFLSNKEDEKLLLDPAWRGKVVKLIAEAVKKYRQPLVAKGG